jgi:hypothetical protein
MSGRLTNILLLLYFCNIVHAEFEYCVPPPATFGTCGDCHCIRGADECPTGVSIPTIDFSQETVDQWKAIKHSNPLQLGCNPYKNTTCDTVPSQEYVELWETAVCAVKYNDTTLDSDQCPAEYATVSYPSEEAAKQDGAFITHYGTCGVCSSLQDLAVYVEYPDLTGAGQECGIVGTFDNQAGIDCFVNIGYTPVRGFTATSLPTYFLLHHAAYLTFAIFFSSIRLAQKCGCITCTKHVTCALIFALTSPLRVILTMAPLQLARLLHVSSAMK